MPRTERISADMPQTLNIIVNSNPKQYPKYSGMIKLKYDNSGCMENKNISTVAHKHTIKVEIKNPNPLFLPKFNNT